MWGFIVQSLMEYTRLTKEQFKALHKEFSIFLATQSIDKEKWNLIKAENPDLTNQKLDEFSDIVWMDVLDKIKYLEHRNNQLLFLYSLSFVIDPSYLFRSLE